MIDKKNHMQGRASLEKVSNGKTSSGEASGRGKVNAREVVLDILMDITENNNFSHTVISKTLNKYQYLEKQDRALIGRICEGTIERLLTLDYILDKYSSVKVNKMKPFIRNLLRMSVYQIKYMDQIPDSAICNEAVKLAKKRGFSNLSGFVNGILRNIIRTPIKGELPLEEKDNRNYLSIYYSVPLWILDMLLKQYDYAVVKQMFQASYHEKKTTIRCNLNKMTLEELKEIFEKSNVSFEEGAYLPYALKISDYNYLSQMEAFKEGYFQVQDESSMLVGTVCGIKEGDLVIDVCAAPGGKSLHGAELLYLAEKFAGQPAKQKSGGLVLSRDVSEYKVNLIKENAIRLGFTNIIPQVWDALTLDEENIGKGDVVIADLPCSGLGVIGKKPDIKYNMTKEKIADLVILQRKILSVVHQYVKINGCLLYSTCTVNREENEENLNWFLQNYPFQLESIEEYLPEKLWNETTKKGYIQLIPGIHDTDGFFLAKLRRY